MKLSQLLNNVKTIHVTGNAELIEIKDITIDSRAVKKDSLFVAIKGYKTDGHRFILDAINKGAVAIILEDNYAVPDQVFDKSGLVKILVKSSRKALSEISDEYYNHPSEKLQVIGITGTKGKTTTAFYLKSILEEMGDKCGLIGTIANYAGNKELKSRLTTPEANEINFMMQEMLSVNSKYCVMEVSSHSLSLDRVANIDFDSAIFTNIASDHLDFHKTFENYLAAKKILFDQLKPNATAIYNIDDINSPTVISSTKAKTFSFGTNLNAYYKLKNIQYDFSGTKFDLFYKERKYSVETKLIGLFNAFNAVAALAAATSLGIDIEQAVEGIKNTPQVPGRFELIQMENKKVIIDYAHNASSLKEVLMSLQHVNKEGRTIHTVFGCGGDRDRTKRPVMGKIADELSDVIYVTSDNPRTEDPNKIIDDVIKGISRKDYHRVENREEAIKTAIEKSEDNAVILIAGKGHENYQEINGVRSYFSDKETAMKYLSEGLMR
ncbi:MAG: UDP-N-acetylmuramoyl-L-alanyl-D-glutamate--2,6-diaminopimelate ligase [Ignavibacteriales bacterium]|jgi:UDP-N-acetylmuramoyl-L-alanyl-D-glutamate--2,6-diaminopimelate ligase|nr:MAG: UDP-N-acetylmuramoyl-L-alanyl-D-glutamate--2,6-diaminopimelate ligase [Ignavibacteriales bacterium]